MIETLTPSPAGRQPATDLTRLDQTATSSCVTGQRELSLCYYRNATNQLQIIQINQEFLPQLERIVFPHERILFYSTVEASLEIYTKTTTGLEFMYRVPCAQLQVLETVRESKLKA